VAARLRTPRRGPACLQRRREKAERTFQLELEERDDIEDDALHIARELIEQPERNGVRSFTFGGTRFFLFIRSKWETGDMQAILDLGDESEVLAAAGLEQLATIEGPRVKVI
jgi:hypothetical protein